MTVIALKDISFSWPKQKRPVLQIETFKATRGERIFLSGESGCGKSTLLSVIGGITVPQSGQVEVLGRDLVKMRASARDSFRVDHIGFIFQQFNLINYLSVLDNVVLPCSFSEVRRARIHDLDDAQAQSVEAAKAFLLRLKIGADIWQRPVSQLSVGQQQRVSIARALIGNPEVIIADEPTSALDSRNQHAFLELLMQECASAQTCLIFASHDLRFASQFDRHVLMAELNTAAHTAEVI